MKLCFTETAWQDYQYWQAHASSQLTRINELIQATLREPFKGIGKPEPLKHKLKGCWSRRIDREHRLVYTIQDGMLVILQCRYHY
jgi:toxin YoeB